MKKCIHKKLSKHLHDWKNLLSKYFFTPQRLQNKFFSFSVESLLCGEKKKNTTLLFPLQVMDIINEEEKQFLKTLGRGRRVFERTIEKSPPGTGVIPGGKQGD